MANSSVWRGVQTPHKPAERRYGIRVVLLAVAVSIVGIPFGWLTHEVVTDGPFTAFDEGFAVELHERIAPNDAWVAAAEGVSFLGKPIVLFVVVGGPCVWLLRHRAYKLVLFLVVTSLGGGLVDTVVKLAVGRPRPSLDEPVATAFGKSFPSGHSMSSVICYGALYLVFASFLRDGWRRLVAAVAVVLPLTIGLSRLALGVHFVSDVVGGFLLGIAWLCASVAAFELYRIDRGRRSTEALHEGIEPEEAADVIESGDHGPHSPLRTDAWTTVADR